MLASKHRGNGPTSLSIALVFEAFLDLVVLGTLVEPRQHLPRRRRHIRPLIILPGELLNRLQGVEPHNRNELYLIVAERPAQELDALVSGNLLLSYTREDLMFEEALVLIGVVGSRPSVPDPPDHAILLLVCHIIRAYLTL